MERHSPNSDQCDDRFDCTVIRSLMQVVLDLSPRERFALVKGLVPEFVDAVGVSKFDDFLCELRTEARRYEEINTHPDPRVSMRPMPVELGAHTT